MITDVLFIVAGLTGLYFGGDWLVAGASKLARSFGLSTLVIGLTVVAFGTSTPELLVSVSAALGESSDISIGNVVGSNIANIGLILGATGLVFPISVHIGLLRREIPILLVVTIATLLLMFDGEVSRMDGILMMIGLLAFNAFMIYSVRREKMMERKRNANEPDDPFDNDDDDEPIETDKRLQNFLQILVGLGLLLIGAQLTVQGAVSIARDFGVSELVIGITLVAFGTSLPELATSLIAAFQKQSDIAIGNVVGSNIYNLLSILGLTSLIHPIEVNPDIVNSDGLIMVGFTILLLPLVWNRIITRREALMLLTLYSIFIVYTVVR